MAVILSLVVIVCGCLYAAAVRKKIAHSSTAKERLSWTLPALVAFAAAPCLIRVDEGAILQGLQAWSIAWVGGAKLVSVALRTSPIDANCTGPQFILQILLPILPVDRVKNPAAPAQTSSSLFVKLLIAASLEVLLFVPLIRDLAAQTWSPHPVVEAVIVCGVLWTFLEMLFHALNLFAAALSVPTKPCMRSPHISSSLRDFWARRWNLPTSESLRTTFYDPLVSLLAPAPARADPGPRPPSTSTTSSSATPNPSAATLSKRGTSTGSSAAGAGEAAAAGARRRRTPREQWAAFAGLSFAFLLSGAVHHWLIGLFTNNSFFSDCRFGLLFWIQPPMIVAQEAWIRSAWWRGVKERSPSLAWLVQWASTVTLFLVPCWFLMRGPFLDNAGGREFVLFAMRDLSAACTAALPADVCNAATRLEPLLDAAFGR